MTEPLALPTGFDALPEEQAKRILELAAERQRQLHWMEQQELRLASRGQWIALSLSVLFGVNSLWVTLAGHDAVGGTIAGTTVVALATAFIVGRRTSA